MTSRQAYENLLIELSKVGAPSLLLNDFNYFINKAIQQYTNKQYNIYDISQQTTDNLRVLKTTSKINTHQVNGAIYEAFLPLDYMHILNCICEYKLKGKFKCYNEGDIVQFAAKRLTADSWSIILSDYYNRPQPKNPYYYINNVNKRNSLPTNPINDDILNRNTLGTDSNEDYLHNVSYITKYKDSEGNIKSPNKKISYIDFQTEEYKNCKIIKTSIEQESKSNLPRTINLKNFLNNSTVEREAGVRYGNPSAIRCEIRYGDDSIFELQSIIVEYLKTPQTIKLTQEQINLVQDTSQILEFPDYVCNEIINELTMLVMSNIADPRLTSNVQVTQSIANPAQQQTE